MPLDMGLFEGIENVEEILAGIPEDPPAGGAVAEAVSGGAVAEAVSGEAPRHERLDPGTLFIDADACPVTREALAEARRAHVPVVIAGNTSQNLEHHIRPDDPRVPEEAHPRLRPNGKPGFWVTTLVSTVGADSADFAIVENLQPGDVVVTQDIGLASMCLGRGAEAIGVRGRVYDRALIDSMLFIRHEEKKVRRQGGRTKGPDAFTDEDRHRFTQNLRRLLEPVRTNL